MRSILLVLVAAALCLAPALGDDWPQYLGPRRDGVWRESGIVDTLPASGPPVLWKAPVSAGYSGPAVAKGKVFLTDRVLAEGAKNHDEGAFPQRPKNSIPGTERVLCFDQATGKLLWKHEYDCPYTVSYPLGPRCTPVVHAGKVWTLGSEGHLLCLDAGNGNVLWRHDLQKEYQTKAPIWGYAAHPLLDGQRLICMVGGKDSAVVAFDKDTGKEIWRSLDTPNIGYCPPSIHEVNGKRQLLIWHGQAAASLDPATGKPYWTYKLPTYQAMSIAMPQLWEGKAFFTAYPQVAQLLDLSQESTPAPLWKGDRNLGLFSVFSTPLVVDGHIYGSSTGGKLVCLDAATGQRKWESMAPLRGKRLDSGEFFLTRQGDRFLLFTEFGDLIFARLSPKGYEEVSRANLLPATSSAFGRDVLWSAPAFAGRCLFTRNDRELICVSLAKATPGE